MSIRTRDDDDNLLSFIKSKPTCFLILGKRQVGKTTLAQKISEYYNAKHITFDNVFRQGLEKEYDDILNGSKWKQNNNDGNGDENNEQEEEEEEEDEEEEEEEEEPINEEMEGITAHLTPVASIKKFSKREKRMNQMILSGERNGIFSKIQLKLWQGHMITDDEVTLCLEQALADETCAHYGYVLDDLPWKEPQKALEKIKTWKLQPDIIIDLKISDQDISTRRITNRIDASTGNTINRIQYDAEFRNQVDAHYKKATEIPKNQSTPDDYEDEQEDDFEDEDEDNENSNGREDPLLVDFPKMQIAKENLIVRKLDQSQSILKCLEKYHAESSGPVANLKENHDQLKVLTLDGLNAPSVLFEQVKSNLAEMSGRNIEASTIMPIDLLPGPEEDELQDEMEDDLLFRSLSHYHRPGPRFRWKKSKFGRFCPVSLLEQKKRIIGAPNCAVAFLGKIYVMANPLQVQKFKINPRKYLENGPNLPTRISVIGTKYCWTPEFVDELSKKYDAEVISPTESLDAKLNVKILAAKEAIKEQLVPVVVKEMQDEEFNRLTQNYNRLLQEYEMAEANAADLAAAAGQAEVEGDGAEGEDGEAPAASEPNTIPPKPTEPPEANEIKIDTNSEPFITNLNKKVDAADVGKVFLDEQEIVESLPKWLFDNSGSEKNFIMNNFPRTAEEMRILERNQVVVDDFMGF